MTPIDSSLTFGDVIEYMEDRYIFLVSSLNFVYIARILTDSETKQFDKMHEDHLKKGLPTEEKSLFWFVRLTCDDFRGQWAHLAHAQKGVDIHKWFVKITSVSLNKKDLTALKKEILEKRTWDELKELVKGISI